MDKINAKPWAQKRNTTKFRLGGLRRNLAVMLLDVEDVLAFEERRDLTAILARFERVMRNWHKRGAAARADWEGRQKGG